MNISAINRMPVTPVRFGSKVGPNDSVEEINRKVSQKMEKNPQLGETLITLSPAEAAKFYKTQLLGLQLNDPLPADLAKHIRYNLSIPTPVGNERSSAIFGEMLKLEPASEG